MAATIQINAVTGSNDDLPINTLVQLNDAGGVGPWLWAIVDQPPGPADNLSATNIRNPTFTPKKEGTYRLTLVVGGGTSSDDQIAGIRHLKSRERVPAAGEFTESGSRGWAGAAGQVVSALGQLGWQARLDQLNADPFVGVGVASGALTANQVVRPNGESVIKSGLPGQETVATWSAANSLSNQMGIVIGDVQGNAAVANGALFRVRLKGMVYGVVGVPASTGVPVYVTVAGALTLTPPGNALVVGLVKQINVGPGTYDFWFDPSLGPGITFNLTALAPAPGNTPVTIQAALAGGQSQPLLQMLDAASNPLAQFDQVGDLDFNSQLGGTAHVVHMIDPTAAQDGATKHYVDLNSAPPMIQFGNSTTPSAAGTTFLDPCFGARAATANEPQFRIPVPCKVQLLRVRARVGPTTDTIVLTVRKNGVDQTITCTLAAGGQDASDLVHTFTCAAGDLISVKAVSGAAITVGASDLCASMAYTTI